MKKRTFPCELALLMALLINSFCVSLMVKASFGISTLSSVPLVLSEVFPALSFGVWNFGFQALFLLILVVVTRNPDPRYLLSFVIAWAFGNLLDIWAGILPLPTTLALRILYCGAGLVFIGFGAGLFVKCRLPVLPFDAFVRDLSLHFTIPVPRIKTPLDIACVTATILISLVAFGRLVGVGVGTVVSALCTGTLVGFFCGRLDRYFDFACAFAVSEKLMTHRPVEPKTEAEPMDVAPEPPEAE